MLAASSLLAASALVQQKRYISLIVCLMTTWLAGCVKNEAIPYDCTVFPSAAESPYILPWMIGTTHQVYPHAARNRGPQKYAIDALMPIGTPVLAMRDGVVVAVEESFVDGDNVAGHENHIFVDHEDGTVARYVHLTYGGAVFSVGDRIRQGEIVAYSGHTGNSTDPHLHVDLTNSCCTGPSGETLPMNFRNASTPAPRELDLSCGLLLGVRYTAEPY